MKVRLPKGLNTKITSSKDIYEVMHRILMRQNKIHRQKEYFWVIGLSTSHQILYIEVVAIGNLNRIYIDAVEVFCFAVARKCKRIILVHNHPSGNLHPSESDKKLTETLIKGGKYLNIEVFLPLQVKSTDNGADLFQGLLPSRD